MKKIIFFLIGFLVLEGVSLEQVTVRCKAWSNTCEFRDVSFNMETKLIIERSSWSDKDVIKVEFWSSNVSLLHPDIAAKFPNIQRIYLWDYNNQLLNQEKIENCENITNLALELRNFTGISSSTFTSCTKLNYLHIETNSITDFPDGVFENQRNLEELQLRENGLNLRVKPFEPLVNLKTLGLSGNLGVIEKNFFQVLKNLEYLRFSAQPGYKYVFPIESLEAQSSLSSLKISYVNMSQLPDKFVPTLRTLINLKSLDLWSNLITSIEEFTDLPQITEIDFRWNIIEKLPANAFKGCSGLRSLYLSDNRISSLRQFSQLTDLKYLSLYGNRISSLRGDEFSQLTGLESLRLSGNNLKSIATNTFHPLTNLQQLYLSENRIQVIEKELFENNPDLWWLELNLNKIKAIHPEAFNNLLKLSFIYLRANNCIDGLIFASVGTLDLELIKEKLATCFQNYLKNTVTCDFVWRESDYICYIRGVEIKQTDAVTLAGQHLPGKSDSDVNLVIIFISKLDIIPATIFSQFENIRELNVEFTGLEELNQLEFCGKLESFKAGHNNIKEIASKTFKDCKSLKFLDLNSNKITAIHPEAFDNLSKLHDLDLQGNVCVDEKFEGVDGETVDWELIKGNLETCFQNSLERNRINT